eukprot:718799-Karenia_brevis.AAC.1
MGFMVFPCVTSSHINGIRKDGETFSHVIVHHEFCQKRRWILKSKQLNYSRIIQGGEAQTKEAGPTAKDTVRAKGQGQGSPGALGTVGVV